MRPSHHHTSQGLHGGSGNFLAACFASSDQTRNSNNWKLTDKELAFAHRYVDKRAGLSMRRAVGEPDPS